MPAVLVERAGIEVGQVEPGRLDPFGQVEERGAADPLLDVGARHPQHVRQVVRRDLGRDLLGLRVLRDVLELDGELGMGGVDRLDGGLEGRQLLRRHADLQSQADRTGRRRRARAGADDDGHEHEHAGRRATIAFGARWSSAWHLPLGDGGRATVSRIIRGWSAVPESCRTVRRSGSRGSRRACSCSWPRRSSSRRTGSTGCTARTRSGTSTTPSGRCAMRSCTARRSRRSSNRRVSRSSSPRSRSWPGRTAGSGSW